MVCGHGLWQPCGSHPVALLPRGFCCIPFRRMPRCSRPSALALAFTLSTSGSRGAFHRMLILVVFVCSWGATPVRADEVTVYAAASLSDALTELAVVFVRGTGHTVRFNFGSSGLLARQIREGAPADVFFSADEERMDQLEKQGLIESETRRAVLANTLVVVVARTEGVAVTELRGLLASKVRRVAIGEPATVPAGTYAKAHLTRIGLWQQVAAKTVPMENARAVLSTVESGNADAGFVYKTDALASKRVQIAVEISREEGPAIVYPVAVVQGTARTAAARAFVQFVSAAEAQRIFARLGFLPVHSRHLPPEAESTPSHP